MRGADRAHNNKKTCEKSYKPKLVYAQGIFWVAYLWQGVGKTTDWWACAPELCGLETAQAALDRLAISAI
jgi:hypothetical protein